MAIENGNLGREIGRLQARVDSIEKQQKEIKKLAQNNHDMLTTASGAKKMLLWSIPVLLGIGTFVKWVLSHITYH